MDQKLFGAISKLADRYCEELGRFTVAFFIEDSNAWMHWGSGILLEIADVHFVVTACHVIERAIERQKPPFFIPEKMRIGALPSSPQGILLSGHGIYKFPDPHDFALVELKTEDVDLLHLDKRFLDLAGCDARAVDPKDAYFLLGFPGVDSVLDKTAKETTSALHGYLTVPYDRTRGEMTLVQFNPDFHVAFDHLPGTLRNYEGEATGFPSPGGASGSGIWKLNVAGCSPTDIDPSNATLAAVYHSSAPGRETTIGTPFNLVLAGLRQIRADLKPIIDAAFPG